jgi:hypothetical protein
MIVLMVMVMSLGIRLPFKPGLAVTAAAHGTHHYTSAFLVRSVSPAAHPRR